MRHLFACGPHSLALVATLRAIRCRDGSPACLAALCDARPLLVAAVWQWATAPVGAFTTSSFRRGACGMGAARRFDALIKQKMAHTRAPLSGTKGTTPRARRPAALSAPRTTATSCTRRAPPRCGRTRRRRTASRWMAGAACGRGARLGAASRQPTLCMRASTRACGLLLAPRAPRAISGAVRAAPVGKLVHAKRPAPSCPLAALLY